MTPGVAYGRFTRRDLVRWLRPLGLGRRALLVHCSMSRFGWIVGGKRAMADALRDAAGASTTIVVPTHTANNSLTSRAHRDETAGMTTAQRREFEATMPGFDRDTTKSYQMGAVAEHIRMSPSAVRSRHPHTSFTAIGPLARRLLAVHDLDCHLGERSPLGRLYRMDAHVLMLGTDYDACTALHLAEYRLPWAPAPQRYWCFVKRDGRDQRVEFDAVQLIDDDFETLGEAMDGQDFVSVARIGAAKVRVFPMRAAVDFAVKWMSTHRVPSPTGGATPLHLPSVIRT